MTFSSELKEISNYLSNLKKVDKKFCHLFPPDINSFSSFVVNLPIILLWILSIPIRYFFCIILSLTNIPIYGLIANLFPPSTLLCSVCSGQPNNCYSNCPACQNYNECIGLPSIYTNFCLQANQYFSILNTIFCLIGYVMATILLPITEFINLILAFTGYQICLYTNPDNCFPGEYQCNDLQYGIGSPR